MWPFKKKIDPSDISQNNLLNELQNNPQNKSIFNAIIVARLCDNEPEALHEEGVLFYRNGQYRLAIAKYTQSLLLRPGGNTEIYRGDANVKIEAYEKAIIDYEAAMQSTPETNREYLRNKINEIREKLSEPMPTDSATEWANLGNKYLNNKEFTYAKECFNIAFSCKGGKVIAYEGFGDIHFEMNELLGAEWDYSQALKEGGENTRIKEKLQKTQSDRRYKKQDKERFKRK